jgi:hypothetical protein
VSDARSSSRRERSGLDRVRTRVDDLELAVSKLEDQLEDQRTQHEILRRDVTWILRVSMGAAAVISFLVSLAARLI